MRDDGEDCRRRVTDVDITLPQAVYTGVQMLEILEKTATSRHFWGRSACLPRGTVRSARLLAVSISALRYFRRGDQETSWRREPESAISTSADCSLSQHGVRSAECGVRSLKSHVRASISLRNY